MLFGVGARRKTAQSKDNPFFRFYTPPAAGIEVDDSSAFTYSAFYACMRIMSETPSYLPWHVMASGSKRQIVRDHPLDAILFSRPNDEMNSFTYRELLMQHLLGWGNSYSEIERNRAGDIVNLWPIDPSRVTPDRDSNGRLYYEIANQGQANTQLQAKDVLHVRGPSRDGINGYSIISLAKESISLGLATEAFGSSFFGNGAIPGTVITNDGTAKLEAQGVINLLKTFNKKHKGPRNARKAEYLDAGLDIKPIGIPPEDAQFLETRQFQVREICRWFRIPPHKLADLERSTHSNIEAQNIEFVTDAVLPWVSRIEQQVNFSLIRDTSKYYNKINVMGILRGDSKARAEYYKILAGLGVLSIDEIRDKEDYDSIGDAGGLRLVPLNMTTPEKMLTGDVGQSNISNLANETARRMAKIEITRAKKLAEKPDLEAVKGFYIKHARDLVDSFSSLAGLIIELSGGDSKQINSKLTQFFGDYAANSADQLQNAIENSRLNALFCSWEARKAENLARDFMECMANEKS